MKNCQQRYTKTWRPLTPTSFYDSENLFFFELTSSVKLYRKLKLVLAIGLVINSPILLTTLRSIGCFYHELVVMVVYWLAWLPIGYIMCWVRLLLSIFITLKVCSGRWRRIPKRFERKMSFSHVSWGYQCT